MTRSFHLRAKAQLDNLSDIRNFVDRAAREIGLGGRSLSDLAVAVDEAVTNVILHGYRERAGDLDIHVEGLDSELFVRLRDDAPLFDPADCKPPELDEPLHSRPVGGMGVYLMHALTDSVSHRVTSTGGNETVLVMKL